MLSLLHDIVMSSGMTNVAALPVPFADAASSLCGIVSWIHALCTVLCAGAEGIRWRLQNVQGYHVANESRKTKAAEALGRSPA